MTLNLAVIIIQIRSERVESSKNKIHEFIFLTFHKQIEISPFRDRGHFEAILQQKTMLLVLASVCRCQSNLLIDYFFAEFTLIMQKLGESSPLFPLAASWDDEVIKKTRKRNRLRSSLSGRWRRRLFSVIFCSASDETCWGFLGLAGGSFDRFD